MRHRHVLKNLSGSLARWLLLEVPLVVILSASSLAQAYSVLHTFTGDDGSSPFAGVTVDRAGNLYGTTKYGGLANCDLGCGVVFKVAPQGSGWNFADLYKFAGPSDGKAPIARVVFGPDGRLYGTTFLGGTLASAGTVFTLTPPPTICRGSCSWIKTTIWSFTQFEDDDGRAPGYGDLVFDSAGSIYGTTEEGGVSRPICGPGCGTVYMLSRSQGSWNETRIYQFGDGTGYHPYAGVTFDGNGNLFGTTFYGGQVDVGLIYELISSDGMWVPAVLLNFLPLSDSGSYPSAGLLEDSAGNFFGTASTGGSGGGGTVYELSPVGLNWQFTVLHSFEAPDHPFANVTMDAAGNLYGTTNSGGSFHHGNVFKLTPTGDSWTYTSLYDFTGGSDGGGPYGNVALDAAGNLYGTAEGGGSTSGDCLARHGCGVVWQIKP